MSRIVVLLLCLIPGFVLAQTYPALYDVTDVADNDVLNLRAAPDAKAEIIGALDPAGPAIEVILTSPDESWGMVNVDERTGWAAMRHLVRQTGQDGDGFPKPLVCFGTEPFWNAFVAVGEKLQFNVLGETPLALSDHRRVRVAGRSDKYAEIWGSDTTSIVAVVTRAACNDGMSDRAFGFSADFVVAPLVGGGIAYSGCCSLSQD